LIIIFLLSVSLVAVLLFGLQSPQPKAYTPEKRAELAKALPQIAQPAAQPPAPATEESGPYGAQEAASSPGENPYQ